MPRAHRSDGLSGVLRSSAPAYRRCYGSLARIQGVQVPSFSWDSTFYALIGARRVPLSCESNAASRTLLQATLLFDTFQRRIFEPWFAMSERMGGHVPTIMRDTRTHRAWPLLMAALFFGLWWFTGTPGGADAFQRVWH